MKLSIKNLSAGYNGKEILHDISLSINTGEIVCLLGPNGSGKTTLFKSILGLIHCNGDICIDDKPVRNIDRKELARNMAYIPQIHVPPFPFTSFDVVLTGRLPFINIFSSPTCVDRKQAMEALKSMNIEYLTERNYAQLSGGERQLVLIARALAQSPKFLVMDEPTSHLDYGNQIRTLHTVKNLAKKGIAVLLTTHVPDHAFLCSSRVIAMKSGHILSDGLARECLTQRVLREMYGIDIDIISLPSGGCSCAPAGKDFL
jgi:iron complex transport system ATP-binding protein